MPCAPLSATQYVQAAAILRARSKGQVKALQLTWGLTADGIVGPRTLGALYERAPLGSFPLTKLPPKKWDYHAGMRRFGAPRGQRAHAGVDLYAALGTSVLAVADGTVRRVAPFYAGTDAVEVDHGAFVARYGEVRNARVRAGDAVRQGEQIAEVGHLIGVRVPSDMLHAEIFAGTLSGPLTVPAGQSAIVNGMPTMRRRDLLDPTAFLDAWAQHLPK